jgi:hypothetical protein
MVRSFTLPDGRWEGVVGCLNQALFMIIETILENARPRNIRERVPNCVFKKPKLKRSG